MLRNIAEVFVTIVCTAVFFAGCENNSSIIDPQSNGGENATLRLSALGGCEDQPVPQLADSDRNDELLATVEDGKVSFTHLGALFNCCMDSVSLDLEAESDVISIVETAHTAQPCLCDCEYTIYGEVLDLEPGTYTIQICPSMDSEEPFCSVVVTIN